MKIRKVPMGRELVIDRNTLRAAAGLPPVKLKTARYVGERVPGRQVLGVDTCSVGCGREPEHRQMLEFGPYDGNCEECLRRFMRSPEGRKALRLVDAELGKWLRKEAAKAHRAI